MSEREYKNNSTYTNYCKMAGYAQRSEAKERMFRNIGYIIYCANQERSKREPIHRFWPLPSDKKTEKDKYDFHSEDYKKLIQEVKKAHSLL